MKRVIFRRVLSLMIILALVLPAIPGAVDASAAEQTAAANDSNKPLYGKTLSILGDSISSFTNHSNGKAAKNGNCTIKENIAYYPEYVPSVAVEDTWWKQAAQKLGMEILVNNSWSGSCLLTEKSGTVGAYVDRCVQLHDNTGSDKGKMPDLIAVFMGTNDFINHIGTLGTFEDINFDKLITGTAVQEDGETKMVYTYDPPTTTMEAYAICLHKISQAYPEAEVYCFTLLPRYDADEKVVTQHVEFNEDIRQLAKRFGANLVDLEQCGISIDPDNRETYLVDGVHPNANGMDAITGAFVDAILNNEDHFPEKENICKVTFATQGVVVEQGTTWSVIRGESFEASLVPLAENSEMEVTVTMEGQDITQSSYANGRIYVDCVSADLQITARSRTSVIKQDPNGEYYYYVDGYIADTFTGLVKNNFGNWYIINGKVQLTYDGLVTYNGERYYVKGGCVNGFSGLKKLEGTWLYFVDGKVDTQYASLVLHNGMLAYVENGEVDFNKKDLVEYNGNLYYIKYGLWSNGFTGMVKGSDGTWRYIKNGVFDDAYTGLAKSDAGWCYVENGLVNFGFTGFVTYNGSNWYVKYGLVKVTQTGIVTVGSDSWYIKGGIRQDGVTGTYTDVDNKQWHIVNGKVQ